MVLCVKIKIKLETLLVLKIECHFVSTHKATYIQPNVNLLNIVMRHCIDVNKLFFRIGSFE